MITKQKEIKKRQQDKMVIHKLIWIIKVCAQTSGKILWFFGTYHFFYLFTSFWNVIRRIWLMKSIQKDIQRMEELENGLPNLGNSCFLNCILQLIYSIQSLREELIQKSHNVKELKDKESTDILIGKIFDYIKHKNLEKHSIHESLSFLLKKVERLNLFYKINNQQDALETLINIIEELNNQSQDGRIKNLLRIQYSFRCSCMENDLIKETIIFLSKKQTCSRCYQPFAIKYQSCPDYLIVTNDNQNPEDIIVFNKNNKYMLQAMICYRGNGIYGHYMCVRKYKDRFYCFNDERVYKYQISSFKSAHKLILLYKKVAVLEENEDNSVVVDEKTSLIQAKYE